MKLKIEYLTPEELQPYANNAKLHPDAQVKQIANSIQEFEFSDPIGIWGDNEVVEGHGRLLAALQLGLKEVPVIRLDHLTDEQAGRLYKALLKYGDEEIETDFEDDRTCALAFIVLKGEVDLNFERYAEACENRSKAAKEREAKKRKIGKEA